MYIIISGPLIWKLSIFIQTQMKVSGFQGFSRQEFFLRFPPSISSGWFKVFQIFMFSPLGNLLKLIVPNQLPHVGCSRLTGLLTYCHPEKLSRHLPEKVSFFCHSLITSFEARCVLQELLLSLIPSFPVGLFSQCTHQRGPDHDFMELFIFFGISVLPCEGTLCAVSRWHSRPQC